MQPTRIAPFENIWARSIDLLNQQLATTIDMQLWFIEMLQFSQSFRAMHSRTPIRHRNDNPATLPDSPRRANLAANRVTACDLNDRIGIWVNEGGAGGEVNR